MKDEKDPTTPLASRKISIEPSLLDEPEISEVEENNRPLTYMSKVTVKLEEKIDKVESKLK
jgi:hypothetical protein